MAREIIVVIGGPLSAEELEKLKEHTEAEREGMTQESTKEGGVELDLKEEAELMKVLVGALVGPILAELMFSSAPNDDTTDDSSNTEEGTEKE